MYLIFGGQCYYPNGGANDIIGNDLDLNLAVTKAKKMIGMTAITRIGDDEDDQQSHEIEWVQVLNVSSGVIEYKSEDVPCGDATTLKIIR